MTRSMPLVALLLVAPLARAEAPATAPDFTLPRLADGVPVRLSQLRGRTVVVDFWATWCEPCKRSLPEHEKLAREHPADLVVVTVNVDETEAPVRRFVERTRFSLPVLLDPSGRIADLFGVAAMPYAVVLDADGRIATRVPGEPYPALREAVARALASQQTPPAPPVAAARPAPRAEPGCANLAERQGVAMGTKIQLAVCPGAPGPAGEQAAREAAEAGFREFGRLEGLWTTWRADSEISRVNLAAGHDAVAVSAETRAVIEAALAGSARTDGLFDITFAPLGEVWRFDTPPESHVPVKLEKVPTPDEVQARLARVGFRHVVVDAKAGTVRLDREGMSVNLGGIGKGAAVDKVVALLRARGLRDFAVQAGGDLYCAGHNGQRPWRVGIAHPRRKGEYLGLVDVTDAAFSTSGDYERFAIIDGRRYHHIIDLRTGYPATASQSATVLVGSATEAEVLTKTAFILGGEAGLLALARAGAKGLIVDAEGRVFRSEGLPLVAP